MSFPKNILNCAQPQFPRLLRRHEIIPPSVLQKLLAGFVVPSAQMIHLETERLLLRMFTKDDLDAYARICSDPEVMRFLGEGKPLSRSDAWRHIAIFLGTWQLRDYGTLAIQDKTSGQMIGRVGYIHPEGWPGVELSWMLARQFWGRGLATEAALECLHHGFSKFGFTHVISLIHPENRRSISLAERLGETKEGTTEIFGNTDLIYGIRNDP